MNPKRTPKSYLTTPCCSNRLFSDAAMFPWVAPWEGINLNYLKDPYVYKYKYYNMKNHYSPCNRPQRHGYGTRTFTEPRAMIEGFDFSHSVNDFTPTHCKYNANGTLRCFPKTMNSMKYHGYN